MGIVTSRNMVCAFIKRNVWCGSSLRDEMIHRACAGWIVLAKEIQNVKEV